MAKEVSITVDAKVLASLRSEMGMQDATDSEVLTEAVDRAAERATRRARLGADIRAERRKRAEEAEKAAASL